MTIKADILKAWQDAPHMTTADLARRFKCNPATVHRALDGHRTEDPRSTQPGKNGRKFVPLPEIRIGHE